MPNEPPLTPATVDEFATTLSYALRFDGRKARRQSSELMADITARHLIEHLERAEFVVMKKPLGTPPRAG